MQTSTPDRPTTDGGPHIPSLFSPFHLLSSSPPSLSVYSIPSTHPLIVSLHPSFISCLIHVLEIPPPSFFNHFLISLSSISHFLFFQLLSSPFPPLFISFVIHSFASFFIHSAFPPSSTFHFHIFQIFLFPPFLRYSLFSLILSLPSFLLPFLHPHLLTFFPPPFISIPFNPVPSLYLTSLLSYSFISAPFVSFLLLNQLTHSHFIKITITFFPSFFSLSSF